jgi:hypothetical protein
MFGDLLIHYHIGLYLTLISRAGGSKGPFYFERKYVLDIVSKIFFLKSKCLANYLSKLFCSIEVSKNPHFHCAFDDNVSAIIFFIKQIFRAAEKASPPPFLHSAVQGVR